MKQKRVIIPLLITACFLLFGKYDVQAATTLENQYTNPYYKNVITAPEHTSDVETYSLNQGNVEYTSDLKKIAENFRQQLVNREKEITIYYHSDERITNEYFNSLTNQLFELAVQHTGKGNEGDYILRHCQGWHASTRWSSNSNGGFDLNMTYMVSYLSDAAQEEKVDQAEAEVFQKLKLSGQSDYQKIKAIYDYICENVSYDYTNLDDDTYIQKYTAYAALIDKTAVCQGYASLLYRMALDAGVDARVISGDAGGPHAWNIVRLNGKYYNLDSTWDAGRENYSYFLKSMKAFSDHERDEDYSSSEFTEAYPMAESDYPVNHVHNVVKDEAVEPTCTTEGKTEGSHCSVCNEVLKPQEIIPVLGHNFKDGICTRCKVGISGKWLKSGSKWWYQYEDGSYPAGRLCKIGNIWYGFDASGWMQTRWGIYNNTWYYFSASGAMQTGWLDLNGTKYYLKSDGAMATAWVKIENTWYYMNPSSGAMQTGWLKLGSTWYYLNADGTMAADTWIGDYYVNADGAWVPGKEKPVDKWINTSGRWWYRHADGSYTKSNWEQIGNQWYYFDKDGWMVTGWLKLSDTWYYMNTSGARVSNCWTWVGNSCYYFDKDGKMAADTWIGDYYVNADGAWVPGI